MNTPSFISKYRKLLAISAAVLVTAAGVAAVQANSDPKPAPAGQAGKAASTQNAQPSSQDSSQEHKAKGQASQANPAAPSAVTSAETYAPSTSNYVADNYTDQVSPTVNNAVYSSASSTAAPFVNGLLPSHGVTNASVVVTPPSPIEPAVSTPDPTVQAPAPTPAQQPEPQPTPAPTPTPAPAPTPDTTRFNRSLVSLTFDDGWKSIHNNGLSYLQKYGFSSTQYLNSTPILDNAEGYMNFGDLKDFYAAGHELAWHTQNHTDLTTLTVTQMAAELTIPDSFIAGLNAAGTPVTVPNFKNFASPYGAYNAATTSQTAPVSSDAGQVVAEIMKSYASHRSTDTGYNTKANFDVSNIKVQNMLNTTTEAEVRTWLAEAAANNAWLVLVYHEISDAPVDPDPTYSTGTVNFDAQLNAIKQSNLPVVTVETALAELKAQL